MDISVVIPVYNEKDNIDYLIPRLKDILAELALSNEIILVDGGSSDGTVETGQSLGAHVVTQAKPGYGGALISGFKAAQGDYILTLDADLSHHPSFIKKMWKHRNEAEVIIASRYIRGSIAFMSFFRVAVSKTLNLFFSKFLSLPTRDLSSGFRLYSSSVLKNISVEGVNFEVLEEILIKIYLRGYRVMEIPFVYFTRKKGKSHARIVIFGICLFKTFLKMWRLRNSTDAADYEEKAFYSRLLPQKYWNRARFKIIVSMALQQNKVLDIGCGSSMIFLSLTNAVGLDVAFNKLRYMSKYDCLTVNGALPHLPFQTESFECIICSEVIEHVPLNDLLFEEMYRVLKPNGTLIIGTPDYATLSWRVIEPIYALVAPNGYVHKHITHYTKTKLLEKLSEHHFAIEEIRYVYGSEVIVRCLKQDVSLAQKK